ncbi:MAG TPA: histidine kinase, partial [Clostridia bacterium]|nr:histidine kinase [Clostridia bacterium]
MTHIPRFLSVMRRCLRNLSFRLKLLASAMFVSAVTLLFASVFFYQRTAAFVQEDTTKSFRMLMNQTQVSVNNVISGIEDASKSIVLNETLERILISGEQGGYELAAQIDDYFSLSKYIAMAAVNENIAHVRLYFMNNAIYTHQKHQFFSTTDAQRKPWHERALFVGGAPVWAMDGGDVVCARAMLRMDAPQDDCGFIEVVLARDKLEAVMENVVATTGGDVCLVDDMGNVVLTRGAAGDAFAARILASGAVQPGDSDAVEGVRAEDERIVTRRLSNHWSLYANLPYGQARAKIRDIALQTLYINTLALLAALAMAAVSSALLARRIRRIAGFMATVDIRSDEYSHEVQGDEMTIVETSFNQLLRTAREAIRNEKEALLRKREADINMLQEQINPHFLYNCLDSINWLAIEAGVKEISDMTMMLGRFYRLGLSKGNQIVPLADELEHARMYLEIMKM